METRFTRKDDGINHIMAALPCDRGVAATVWANARFDGFIRFDIYRGEFVVPDNNTLINYAERVFGLTDEEKK